MRVVLRADVDRLGKRGDLIDVSDGYARNYLVPKGLALTATPGIEGQADAMRRARDVRDAQHRSSAEEIATKLVPTVITVSARAGAEGRLFGSITAADIVEAIADQAGLDLDRRRLELAEPLKALGTHVVSAKLHADVEFPITVEVVAR